MRIHGFTFLTIFTFFSLTIGLIGCDSSSGLDENGDRGQLRVLMTDAPIDSMLEANVTVLRVEMIDTTGATVVASDDTLQFNLLDLQDGITTVLADTLVPAGTYTQIRVVIDEDAYILWADSSETTLTVPSGTQTGIKIVGLSGFTIDEASDVGEILLDFDAARSFVEAGGSGKVLFKPVIKVQKAELNGDEVEVDTTSSAPFPIG